MLNKILKCIVLVLVAIGILYIGIFSRNKEKASDQIKERLINFQKENNEFIMEDITPFNWDRAYVVDKPFIGEEHLDKILGIDTNLKRLDIDRLRRIVFIENDEVVYDFVYLITEFNFSDVFGEVRKEDIFMCIKNNEIYTVKKVNK